MRRCSFTLAAKLGIVRGLVLAQACRRAYGRRTAMVLWVLCELAIVACDLAELLGAAIALKLLFGLPLLWGVSLVGVEVLLLLGLQRKTTRPLEALVVTLMVVIGLCFAIELALAQPPLGRVVRGLLPEAEIVSDPAMLYVAIVIHGATIMPPNLYLHSSIVQSRQCDRFEPGLRQAIRFSRLDVIGALAVAAFVNGAILVLAASTFNGKGLGRLASRMPISSSRPHSGRGRPAPCLP